MSDLSTVRRVSRALASLLAVCTLAACSGADGGETLVALTSGARSSAPVHAVTPDAARRLVNLDPGPPFNHWDIEVIQDVEQPLMFLVKFTSPLLAVRTWNVVLLPDNASQAPRLPATYFLHGARFDTDAFADPTDQEQVDRLLGNRNPPPEPGEPGPVVMSQGAVPRDEAFVRLVEAHQGKQSFVSIVPDATFPPNSWCWGCFWVDGVNGVGFPAESHLYQELIPLVERLFPIQPGREHRAVFGHSMGGRGAMAQASRHPDRFVFLGSFSATLNGFWPEPVTDGFYWPFHHGSQGYPSPVEDEALFRGVDFVDMASNLRGSGMDAVITVGDGCPPAPPASQSLRTGFCNYDVGNLDDTYVTEGLNNEEALRRQHDAAIPPLIQQGVPLTYVPTDGQHELRNSVYEEFFLPHLHRQLAGDAPVPVEFEYKSVDAAFEIWGYRFSVQRPNNEFLHVLNARTDGSTFSLAGTGVVSVTTPATLARASVYEVAIRPGGGAAARTLRLPSDADGRLTFDVDLGPTRTIGQRQALVEAGRFQFPLTRVDITPAG